MGSGKPTPVLSSPAPPSGTLKILAVPEACLSQGGHRSWVISLPIAYTQHLWSGLWMSVLEFEPHTLILQSFQLSLAYLSPWKAPPNFPGSLPTPTPPPSCKGMSTTHVLHPRAQIPLAVWVTPSLWPHHCCSPLAHLKRSPTMDSYRWG